MTFRNGIIEQLSVIFGINSMSRMGKIFTIIYKQNRVTSATAKPNTTTGNKFYHCKYYIQFNCMTISEYNTKPASGDLAII